MNGLILALVFSCPLRYEVDQAFDDHLDNHHDGQMYQVLEQRGTDYLYKVIVDGKWVERRTHIQKVGSKFKCNGGK